MKLQFGGILGNPATEIFSNTVNFVSSDDPNDPAESYEPTPFQLDEALDNLIVPLSAWFSRNASNICSGARLTYAKLNYIQSSGRQRDTQTHQRDFGPVAGGLTVLVPWHQTYALTHRTALRRGRGHAGRIFPPLVWGEPENAGTPYVAASFATGMAASWATALNGISAAIREGFIDVGSQVRPVVASVGQTAAGPGGFPISPLLVAVTSVVCDRVADVQHRRTNQVVRAEGAAAPVN